MYSWTTSSLSDSIIGGVKNDLIIADVKFRSVVNTPSNMDNFMHNCMQWPSTNTKIPMRNTAGKQITRFGLHKRH